MLRECDMWQGFLTLLEFFPERNFFHNFAQIRCIECLYKIILVVSESGLVRMNIRNILKKL